MNVLMFSTDYLPNVGGVAAHVYELAKAICALGHSAVVVTTCHANKQDRSHGGSPPTVRVGLRPRYGRAWQGYRAQFLATAVGKALPYMWRCDVVHFHTVDGLSWAFSALTRFRPQIATNHTSMFVAAAREAERVLPWAQFFGRMRGVIAPSEEIASLTVDIGIPEPRVHYIPNGVDPGKFSPHVVGDGLRGRYGVLPEEPLVLCPRRLVPKNGILYLARAVPSVLSACPSARFMFVGDGPGRGDLEAVLHSSGVLGKVVFTGALGNCEMPAVYAASDLVVIPSLVEATSIAALEAMASGRAVIATRVGGLPALVDHQRTGLLVDPADSDAMAAAIVELLSRPDWSAQMGERARARVLAEFTWARIAELTVDAYRSFLGRQGRV